MVSAVSGHRARQVIVARQSPIHQHIALADPLLAAACY
jgi:hypothetical protein